MTNPILQAPCADCPFLKKGGIRLRRTRIKDLARNALSGSGGSFSCHKTVKNRSEDDEGNVSRGPGPGERQCAGMLIFAQKQGRQNQMARIGERLGLYRPSDLKGQAQVFDSVEDMLATAVDKPKVLEPEGTGEPCSVADAGCTAPAGWDRDGYVETNEEADAEYECDCCKNPVCGACSKEVPVKGSRPKRKVRLCNDCAEEN